MTRSRSKAPGALSLSTVSYDHGFMMTDAGGCVCIRLMASTFRGSQRSIDLLGWFRTLHCSARGTCRPWLPLGSFPPLSLPSRYPCRGELTGRGLRFAPRQTPPFPTLRPRASFHLPSPLGPAGPPTGGAEWPRPHAVKSHAHP